MKSAQLRNAMYIANTCLMAAADDCRRTAESMTGSESTGKNAYEAAARLIEAISLVIRTEAVKDAGR